MAAKRLAVQPHADGFLQRDARPLESRSMRIQVSSALRCGFATAARNSCTSDTKLVGVSPSPSSCLFIAILSLPGMGRRRSMPTLPVQVDPRVHPYARTVPSSTPRGVMAEDFGPCPVPRNRVAKAGAGGRTTRRVSEMTRLVDIGAFRSWYGPGP